MAYDQEPYRSPAVPPPQLFPLQQGPTVQRGAQAIVGAAVLSFVTLSLTAGHGFVCFAAAGSAVVHLLGGGAKQLEVRHDRVVLRYWMRRARELPTSELRVQHMADELILIHERSTLGILAEYFPGKSFDECGRALAEVADDYLDRR